MTTMRIPRRQFLMSSGAAALGAAGAVLANPKRGQGYYVAQASGPETTGIRLGYLPILEAAPLIIAKEKGLFTKHGMPDVEVLKQASWAAARDNVEIGSAGGGIDGGQWQMPMPHLITEGMITKENTKIPMYVLLQTSTHGNGIAIASKHLGKGLDVNASKAVQYIAELKSKDTPFTAAFTFPRANQELWIRLWLAGSDINPDDVKLIVVPPAQTVANMQTGIMDGFSTGDPWPYRIAAENIGFMAALTAQLWPDHPEEYLAIRADWVDKNPIATKALLKAIMEAQQWLDQDSNRPEAIEILSKRNYLNISPEILTPPFEGRYIMGDGRPDIQDKMMGPLFWKDGRGSVSYPYKSHDLWFLVENVRWGYLPANTDLQAIVDKVNREDIWREAAKELGVAEADIPSSTSRGVETFFDGTKFDPNNTKAYLDSLKFKNLA